jgi:hypothetical protein
MTTTASYRDAALTSIDLAIRELSRARDILASQDDQLSELQEGDDFETLDGEMSSALDRLESVEDALSAAGRAYFGEDNGDCYIGFLADRGRRLVRK